MVKLARELTDEAPVGATITSGARQPVTIPVYRYVDPAFADLELQRLWPRVWQLACSTDHVAQPGDAYEYRCGPYSNCHRAGPRRGAAGVSERLSAPGHGHLRGGGLWADRVALPLPPLVVGSLRSAPRGASRRGFGSLPAEQYGLFPVAVDTWGPLVFVDPSSAAGPLDTFLEGVPQDISWVGLDEYHCDYLVTVPLPGNWKVISDGFSETYHVQGLHREMLPSVDDVNGPQRLWHHHGKLEQRYGLPSPRFREPPEIDAVWSSFVEIMGADRRERCGDAATSRSARRDAA